MTLRGSIVVRVDGPNFRVSFVPKVVVVEGVFCFRGFVLWRP